MNSTVNSCPKRAEVYRSARFGHEFTVLFIDLDHFKQVNDTHGHLVGSKLLAEVGNAIKENLRLIDSAFRYGGDEFVVILPRQDKGLALAKVQRLKRALTTTPFLHKEKINVHVTASFGLATFPHDAKDKRALLAAADDCLFRSKADGKNRISVAGARRQITPQDNAWSLAE